MGEIIDFNKYKTERTIGNALEERYLQFLTYVNKFVGVPTSLDKAAEAVYYALRYLEGSVNCISTLEYFGIDRPKDIEGFKVHTIDWLNSIIDNISNL